MNGVSTGKYGRSGTNNLVKMFDIITTMSTSNRRRHPRNRFSTPHEKPTNERFATVAELLMVAPDLAMESCTLFYERRHAAKQSQSARSYPVETRRPWKPGGPNRSQNQIETFTKDPGAVATKIRKKKSTSRNRHNLCTMAQLWHVTYDP